MKARLLAGAIACVFVFGGCDEVRNLLDRPEPAPPAVEDVAPYYAQYRGVNEVRLNGNVIELHVEQPYRQLDRGGSIWARVGPYVYLMTPSTRDVFDAFEGVAAVRVVTHLPDGEEVARAMLRRDTMSDVLWRRTFNLLGRALEGGRDNPRRLEELTEWSEERTEFRYNPEYVS